MPRQRKRGIKGAGSVYQRKSDGRWTGSFKVEETGKRKYVYAPVDNNTERAAYDLLQKALREQEQGMLATGKDQTLKDYLTYWLEKIYKPTVSTSTYARQRINVYKHFTPSLGHVSLRKLTTQHIQTFVAGKIDEGLAASTVKKMCSVLSSALSHAVELKLASQNACKGAILPKVQKRKKQVLTKEQILKLIEVANAHRMGAFIKLGLMSGMRHGEMLALRWTDIDFEARTLSIRHNTTYLAGHGFIEGDPKTDAGVRVIILPQFVTKALLTHREKQQVQRDEAGDKWKEHDLVFCTQWGGHVREEYNLACFRKVLVLVGLPPRMRVHDLRHNVATFLINVLHYPPTLVQALLGHSDVTTTLGMYVDRADPEMLRPMMDDLNKLFGGE
jgi:integrase